MKNEVAKLVYRVRKDDGSAFTIVGFVLDEVIRLANKKEMARDDWRTLALGLSDANRGMAPLYNISNTILLGLDNNDFNAGLAEEFVKVRDYHSSSVDLISRKFASQHNPERVIVNSYSATVMECLIRLSEQVDLTVTVTESLPMGEGVMFAESLASKNVKAEIISDTMVFEWMKKVDMFLSGADAVLPDRILNKVGSKALAHAAKDEGKKTVVVCDSLKVSPFDVGNPVSKMKVLGPRLKRQSCLFESFDASLIDMVITEKWNCRGDELQNMFYEWDVSPLLRKG